MHVKIVVKILGILLVLFSTTHLLPLLVSIIYADQNSAPFVLAFLATFLTGFACWIPVRRVRRDLRYRDGFLVVVLFWTVLALFGSLPLILSDRVDVSITDAIFESMSGLTTTGATLLVNLDTLPPSILFYRQQLQWFGGMGIIVLAVAIMPMLGIGGMQLYRAETPGPMKDSKLTPRITETAKALWYIYLGLTVACAAAYFFAGMSLFDAIGHSFSTIAIGGFSTHDASIGHFDSVVIEVIAMFFMLIAAANFSLHFVAFRTKSLKPYWQDSEYRFLLSIFFAFAILMVVLLVSLDLYESKTFAIHQGLFHLVSVGTTTGFTSGGFAWWPGVLPVMVLLLSFVGGCAGSTAGGIKVMRMQLLYMQFRKEVYRLIHPNAVMSIKVGDQVIGTNVILGVGAFFAAYMFCFATIGLLLCLLGLDWITAFSAAAACLNNLGPGLGEVANNYAGLTDAAKWVLSFAMLLGRLELFTLLVLFTATFWRD